MTFHPYDEIMSEHPIELSGGGVTVQIYDSEGDTATSTAVLGPCLFITTLDGGQWATFVNGSLVAGPVPTVYRPEMGDLQARVDADPALGEKLREILEAPKSELVERPRRPRPLDRTALPLLDTAVCGHCGQGLIRKPLRDTTPGLSAWVHYESNEIRCYPSGAAGGN